MSNRLVKYDFPRIKLGETYRGWTLRLSQADGTPFDFTGCTALAHFRLEPEEDVAPDMVLSTDDGHLELDGGSIVIESHIPAFTKAGTYKYDIWVTYPNGDKFPYVEGSWPVDLAMTR